MRKYILMILAFACLQVVQAQRDTRASGTGTRSSATSERSSSQSRPINQNRSTTPQEARSQRSNSGAGERSGNTSKGDRPSRPIPYAPLAQERTQSTGATARPARPSTAQGYELDYLQNTLAPAPKVKNAPSPTLRAKGGKETVKVNWMTLEQAIEKSKTEKRKIYIDVYTDWCGWCKQMDSTTFGSSAVAQYLNDNYYPVKFNAEQVQDVTLLGKTYKFVKSGSRGHHEVAAYWLNNRLSFPTSVFLDEGLNTIQPLPGYLEATKMEAILHYFGSNSHKTTPWESYERKFSNQRK